MFDIGFWELMLIGVMGLVVLGPERLPVAVRTVRGWITGARKFSDTVKAELSEELRIHELHANLKKAEQGNMANLSPEVAESVKSLQEATAMVNEPFKKVDRTALDSMISTSLANSKVTQKGASALEDNEQELNNDNLDHSQINDTDVIDNNVKDK
ncbi:Sec-independent protein translocase protein TatB [Colwellia sp. MSW7]|uniref:Sec-independent protein translocase protein TatB n=1 Tax=Colwellia maritima TaxID=2912588 RepID=A0ABS9WWF3_9GAMM|nr:Sec-independent protein translocase protein TatB [Colwellia maritima]MCI2282292.1 Sec-independent protein translocase protein TatB [Colwellia maritima]